MLSLKRIGFVLILLWIVFGVTTAQAQSLTIGSVQACAASEVVVPVIGDGINNIGSITLFITFNNTNITFKSVDNIDSQIQNMNYSLLQNPVKLAFAWSGVTPVSFQQKKMFDLRFSYTGNSSDIVFNTDCEIANSKLEIIPVLYNNGQLLSGLPQIGLQPKDTLIKPGASAKFWVNASNAENYSWMESKDNGSTWQVLVESDIYKGTHSSELRVISIPVSFSNNKYNCTINSLYCSLKTSDAVLKVDNQASVNENNKVDFVKLSANPNPVNTTTDFCFNLPDDGFTEILILDLSGKILYKLGESYYLKGDHTITFDANKLAKGIYIGKLVVNNKITGFNTCIKLVKT